MSSSSTHFAPWRLKTGMVLRLRPIEDSFKESIIAPSYGLQMKIFKKQKLITALFADKVHDGPISAKSLVFARYNQELSY